MKAIWEALQSIADMLVNIFEFIISLVLNTRNAMTGIIKAASESMELINTLPNFIKVFASATVTISIIYLILGWSAGKSD